MLCSKASVFNSCIDSLLEFLEGSGYPRRCFSSVEFAPDLRAGFLDKMRNRVSSKENQITAKHRRSVFLSLPFNDQLSNIGIPSLFRCTVGCIIPLDIIMGWSVKVNTMRRLYRLNWPGVRSMGNG